MLVIRIVGRFARIDSRESPRFVCLRIAGPSKLLPLIVLPHYQRRRNDTINKICVLEGVGEGDVLRKIIPKRCFFFLGNSMTIKFGNFANLLSEILLSFGRLLH